MPKNAKVISCWAPWTLKWGEIARRWRSLQDRPQLQDDPWSSDQIGHPTKTPPTYSLVVKAHVYVVLLNIFGMMITSDYSSRNWWYWDWGLNTVFSRRFFPKTNPFELVQPSLCLDHIRFLGTPILSNSCFNNNPFFGYTVFKQPFLSGWWFGCHFFIFPYKYWVDLIIPTDFHMFQGGGPTTNQLWFSLWFTYDFPMNNGDFQWLAWKIWRFPYEKIGGFLVNFF